MFTLWIWFKSIVINNIKTENHIYMYIIDILISINIRFKIADIRSFMVFRFGFPVDGSIWYVFSNFRILFKLFKRLLPFVIELRLVDAGFWPFSWSFCDAGLWGMKRLILRAEMRRFEVFYQVRSLLIRCLPQLRPKDLKFYQFVLDKSN